MRAYFLTIACLQATAVVASVLPTDFGSPQLRLQNNDIHFDASCDATKKATVLREIGHAKEMADTAASNIRAQNDFYYESFFSRAVRAQSNFASKSQNVFHRASELLTKKVDQYPFTVTCKNDGPKCKNPNYFAFVTDKTKTINFCDNFFKEYKDTKFPQPTQKRLDECRSTDPQVRNAFTIRQAHRSLSTIILHEMMHTSYVSAGTGLNRQIIDVAYGWKDCVNLQLGHFNRGTVDYKGSSGSPCKDHTGKDGLCNPNLSAENADSYAFTAAGLWYSAQCGHKIPDPNRSTTIPTQGPVNGPVDPPEDPPEL